ncbi:AAA family ATPase [Spirulina subsalsa]|uniref:AAA family ATPase n=1 Tax=Spirulina subsalsa TaxID=54311 RepID=UPI0002DDEA7F|nr:ATP-binding protein [Spirulina subsalsa]
MRITLKKLGILKQAELEIGDLTIICGDNNTGKTYATYALFGFLYSWEKTRDLEIDSTIIDQVLNEGIAHINIISDFWGNYQNILNTICLDYSKNLSSVFAASEDKFKNADFQIFLDISHQDILDIELTNEIGSSTTRFFSVIKEPGNSDVSITLLTKRENVKIPRDIIKKFISDSLKEILFKKYIPRPFIASAERTGTAIFRQELNFARNRLLEEVNQVEREIDRIQLLLKQNYNDYALPIKENVDFTRNIERIAQKKSQIIKDSPHLLEEFSDIIGGQYTVTPNGELYFIPQNNNKLRLTMDGSSSAVRSLLDIGFYLKHIAQKGDMLMIDEPELNLHPENQRRIARLLAKLVNYGIKVYITTHSDYIIKELNTLIMLNSEKSHIKKIAEAEGYQRDELLNPERIRAYVAKIDKIKLDGNKTKTSCNTLVSAEIDPELGIDIKSFDTAIETMNRIQDAIIWGGES